MSDRRVVLLGAAILLSASAFARGQTPTPASGPTAGAEATPLPRLELDIERRISERLDKELPRFQVEVVGRTPQLALEQHLDGFDPCGAVPHGAPTVMDMAGVRPQPLPALDFSTILMALAQKGLKQLGKGGEERFFVYRQVRPEGVTYLVREGKMPDAQIFSPGGLMTELVAAFPDKKTATRAWRRLERGYETPVAAPWKPCASPR